MPAVTTAQPAPGSIRDEAVALELATLPPPVGVHYSAGYETRAVALQNGARRLRELLVDSLDLQPAELTLLVLDEDDWAAVTELPYGMHSLLHDGASFLAPADVDRGIYFDSTYAAAEARHRVDLIGLHYLAHFFAAEALYERGNGSSPSVKWLDELFTMLLQGELLLAVDPALHAAALRSRLVLHRLAAPRVTRLDAFDAEYNRYFVTPEGGRNYEWFLDRLGVWAGDIRTRHGLRVLLRVRDALARNGKLDTANALELLDRVGVATAAFADGLPHRAVDTVEVREGSDLLAVLSPDGRRAAFLILGQPWLVDVDGGRATPLTDASAEPTEYWGFAWSPDARRVAAWYWEGEPDRGGIRIFDAESGRTSTIDERRDLLGFAWTADGIFLAAAEADSTLLYLRRDHDDASDRIGAIGGRTGHVALSPDGAIVAYTVAAGSRHEPGLWELELGSGARHLIVADTLAPARPAFSPDGRRTAFHADHGGRRVPWVVSRRDGSARPLRDVPDDVHDAPLSWTPDGDSLLYTAGGRMWLAAAASDRAAAPRPIEFSAPHAVGRWMNLRRPDVPEPGERRIVRGILTPALSPRGDRVAFSALGELWLVATAGGAPERLTRTAEDDVRPRWSPDGGRLAWFTVPLGAAAEVAILDIGGTARRGDDTRHGVRQTARRIALPGSVTFEPDLEWHPTADRLAWAGTDLFTREYSVGVIDLTDGSITTLHESRGLGGTLIGWDRRGEHVAFTQRTYDADALRFGHRFHRVATATGAVEPWAVPDTLALRSGWSADLRHVAWSVAGRGYWRSMGGTTSLITDPAPRDFSWSADGRLLLYRTGSAMRLLDVESMSTRTVPLDFTFDVAAAPPPLLLRNVNVVDGTGAPRAGPVDVLIEAGRIAAMEPSGSIGRSDVRAIDGSGMTVLPGLINLHVHTGMAQPRWSAFPYFGTTTVRDAGTDGAWMRAQAERVLAGDVIAPRVFYAGGMIEHEMGHGWMDRPTVDRLDTARVRNVITSLADLGAAVLKIRIRDPVLDRLATDVAHDLGMRVTSHHVFPPTFERGLEGREHTSLLYREAPTAVFRDDVLSLLEAGGTCMTTTLMAGARAPWLLSREDPAYRFPPGTLDTLAPFVAAEALQPLRRRPPPALRAVLPTRFRIDLDNAIRVARSGATIAAATDAGPLDPRLDLELTLLVQGGLTPLEAIRSATLDAARCLGVEHELGSIEVGKRADLLLVRGDPSTDIDALTRIEYVVIGGRVYRRDEMRR